MIRNFIMALRGDASLWVDGQESRRSLAAVLGVYDAAGIGE